VREPAPSLGFTASAVTAARTSSQGPVTAETLALAQAMLEARGAADPAGRAKQLLDGLPELARRLSLLAPQLGDPEKSKGAVQTALRHLLVNAPETISGTGGPARSEARDYARDVGFQDLSFEDGQVTALTPSGGKVDLGAMPDRPSTGDLGRMVNMSRFGTPKVVPPPQFKASNDFRIDNAHAVTHISSLAYQDASTVKNQLEKWGYDVSTFKWIENKDTDTQAFVVNDKNGNTFVSFRGTESVRDAQTDGDALLIPASWAGPNVNVHEGFSNALDSVWPQMQDAIRKARGAAGEKGDVVFTGHSLGGGVATLAALRATNAGLLPPDPARAKVYPIASPRVGDDAFADAYNQKLPQTHRLVTFNSGLLVDVQDVVTQVPPRSAGYHHVGNLVRLSSDGFHFLPREAARAPSVAPPALASGLKNTERRGVAAENDQLNPGIEALRGDALKQYMSTTALQHMERRDPGSARPTRTAALNFDGVVTFSIPSMATMPSVKWHASGEYLRRTGQSLLTQ
jgi:triacylglycerol lipase